MSKNLHTNSSYDSASFHLNCNHDDKHQKTSFKKANIYYHQKSSPKIKKNSKPHVKSLSYNSNNKDLSTSNANTKAINNNYVKALLADNSINSHTLNISIPFASVMVFVHLGAVLALFYFSWSAFYLTLGLIFFTHCIGVSIGMHRLYSHRSFQVPKIINYFIGLCSTLSFQGTIAQWVAHHRMHHAHSDSAHDPHNINQGFLYAHIGWLLYPRAYFTQQHKIKAYSRDIFTDPVLAFYSNKWFLILAQIFLAIILFAIGGISFVLWGICLRLCICYHATWLVNSAAHSWGYKNYPSNDLAQNNWWVALVTWGEGWHNNHHVHQNSVRMGHKWWEIDISYYIIKIMHLFRIAKKLKYPTKNKSTNK